MPKPTQVGLVQINNSFANQCYLPYSVGVLQSYFKAHFPEPDQFEFLLPLYSRVPVQQAVEHLQDAEIVFFSLYVWNEQLSLEIARRLKQANPNVLLVFGGCQVPNRSEDFLRKHPFIDLAVLGPGERPFCDILGAYKTRNFATIPGVNLVNQAGEFCKNEVHHLTTTEIAELPSPFLDGTFEPLFAAYPQQTWLMLWETNRGCPYACSYCDWGSSAVNKVGRFPMERLKAEMDWVSNHKIEFIFCCDANFGIFARDMEIVEYMADLKKRTGYPERFSVQNTKNNEGRSFQIQKLLQETGLNKGAALAMQSVSEVVLTNIGRANIRLDSFKHLQKRFTDEGIQTFTDVILGLPGETLESFIQGVGAIVDGGQHNRIQFNNLSILPNAEMGDPDYQKRHGMIVVDNDIINIHGKLEDEEVTERQQLVVGTHSMPLTDWVEARVFGWMTGLLHFNKLLQLTLIVTKQLSGVSYLDLFQLFISKEAKETKLFGWLLQRCQAKALDIQKGGAEFEYSAEFMGIWWPLDELLLIEIAARSQFDEFYAEARQLLADFLAKRGIHLPAGLLQQATELNQHLLRLPFAPQDIEYQADFNLWELYQSALIAKDQDLVQAPVLYRIDCTSETWTDWNHWSQFVVWYGNKRADYLRKVKTVALSH